MGVQTEIVIPRYVVLTRLADSWIPRASHGDVERAEAEAFRWRRIYGPGRTRVEEFLIPETVPYATALPAPITVSAEPMPFRQPRRHRARAATADAYMAWYDAGLRALTLYLGFGFANRVMELLILLAQH